MVTVEHMDYFTDVLATFLDLDHGNYIAVYVRELSEFNKNIFICVLKMNGGLTGLEWGYDREEISPPATRRITTPVVPVSPWGWLGGCGSPIFHAFLRF